MDTWTCRRLLTPNDSSRLDLVIGKATVFAAEGHHDDLVEIRNRSEEKPCNSLRTLYSSQVNN